MKHRAASAFAGLSRTGLDSIAYKQNRTALFIHNILKEHALLNQS